MSKCMKFETNNILLSNFMTAFKSNSIKELKEVLEWKIHISYVKKNIHLKNGQVLKKIKINNLRAKRQYGERITENGYKAK